MNFTNSRERLRRRGAVRLQITSMIDVIFLLLIYFLVSTTYMPPEAELSQALQAQRVASGAAADFEPQVVEVDIINGAPAYRLGARVIRSKEKLRSLLSSLPKEGGLFIKGFDRAQTEWAAGAAQAAHSTGFAKVTYVPVRDEDEE